MKDPGETGLSVYNERLTSIPGKYHIEADQNEKLVLRISDISACQRKETEYEAPS